MKQIIQIYGENAYWEANMEKNLIAQKCSDKWYVRIIDTYILETESEVLNLIRYNGLKYRKEFSNDKQIYAD